MLAENREPNRLVPFRTLLPAFILCFWGCTVLVLLCSFLQLRFTVFRGDLSRPRFLRCFFLFPHLEHYLEFYCFIASVDKIIKCPRPAEDNSSKTTGLHTPWPIPSPSQSTSLTRPARNSIVREVDRGAGTPWTVEQHLRINPRLVEREEQRSVSVFFLLPASLSGTRRRLGFNEY